MNPPDDEAYDRDQDRRMREDDRYHRAVWELVPNGRPGYYDRDDIDRREDR